MFAAWGANDIGDVAATLQDDDDDEQMNDEHYEPQESKIGRPVEAEQQRYVGDRHAEDRQDCEAPRPDIDIGRSLIANDEQAWLA